MADASIVDELVVKLSLDTSQYEREHKVVIQLVDKTEKKLDQNDKKGKKRDQEAKKRTQESTKAVKQLTEGLGKLAFTVGAMLGIGGGAAGILGAITALTGMETGLRRAAVSTGMSTRQMQAWGTTARRLGADAQSGAAAISSLAREQQQFALTGQGATMSAFARMGVNVGPNVSIQDMLGQAQQVYRQANPAQQKQYEAMLSASGVSDDLIVMIKSEKDAREEYTRSLAEAATENRKALDAVSDALAGMQTTVINVANALATLLQPAVEQFAQWASQGSQELSAFVDKVIAAGGGVDGFMTVLHESAPQLANFLQNVITGFNVLGQAIDVIVFGFKELGRAGGALIDWMDRQLARFGIGGGSGHPVSSAIQTVGAAIKWAWADMVADARGDGAPVGALTGDTGRVVLTSSARARLAAASAGQGNGGAGKLSGTVHDQAQQLMTQLVARGLTPDQAAAVAANAMNESTLGANQFNGAGGGEGAHGLFQWRGDRLKRYRAMFGADPTNAPINQQLDFLFNDPYERRLMDKAFAQGGNAQQLATNFSRIFEANGGAAEERTRNWAAQFAQIPTAATAVSDASLSPGEQIVISGPVTVHANNPQQLVEGIQRVSGVQSYQSAIR